MAKDPAVLFYTSDFLSGTMFLTMEQKGQYITLLCTQHQNGHIPKEYMFQVCGSLESPVLQKFSIDEFGLYYNKRMDEEKEKRSKFCESRSRSRKLSDEDNVRIYMVKDNDTKYTKIGSSSNPDRRFKVYNTIQVDLRVWIGMIELKNGMREYSLIQNEYI